LGPKNNPKENNRALRPFRAWALIIPRKTIGPSPFQGLGPNNPKENNRAFTLSGLGP